MTATGPVRIGAKISPLVIVVWIVLALVFAALMTPVAVGVFGAGSYYGVVVMGGILFVVGLVWIGLLVWRFTPSQGSIDLEMRTLTSSRRSVAFADLTHAYRIPGGESPGEFGVRFEIPRAPDVRLLVSSRSFTDAARAELDAVITMVEGSRITPDPRVPLRPPIGDEAGVRDEDEQRLDATSAIVMLYDETAYTRETLLAELRRARAVAAGDPVDSNTKVSGIISDLVNRGVPRTALPSGDELATVGTPTNDYKRGFFGTLSSRYKMERTRVENWLRESNPNFVPNTHKGLAAIGWSTLAVMFFWPVISLVLFYVVLYATYQFIGPVIVIGLVFAFSPVIIFAAIVVIWLARVRRHSSLRREVLETRKSRVIPSDIRAFFGSPHPEGYIEMPIMFAWGIAWCLALAGGITMIIVGVAPIDGQGYPFWSWAIIGAVLAVGALVKFPAFVGLMKHRTIASTVGELEARLMTPAGSASPAATAP
jgi:hypothetical protein